MILAAIKFTKETFNHYKKTINVEEYQDDIAWAAGDLLLDETTLENYVKNERELGGLAVNYALSLFYRPLFSGKLLLPSLVDEIAISQLKAFFDPENKWDIIKLLTIEDAAINDVRDFLRKHDLPYEETLL